MADSLSHLRNQPPHQPMNANAQRRASVASSSLFMIGDNVREAGFDHFQLIPRSNRMQQVGSSSGNRAISATSATVSSSKQVVPHLSTSTSATHSINDDTGTSGTSTSGARQTSANGAKNDEIEYQDVEYLDSDLDTNLSGDIFNHSDEFWNYDDHPNPNSGPMYEEDTSDNNHDTTIATEPSDSFNFDEFGIDIDQLFQETIEITEESVPSEDDKADDKTVSLTIETVPYENDPIENEIDSFLSYFFLNDDAEEDPTIASEPIDPTNFDGFNQVNNQVENESNESAPFEIGYVEYVDDFGGQLFEEVVETISTIEPIPSKDQETDDAEDATDAAVSFENDDDFGIGQLFEEMTQLTEHFEDCEEPLSSKSDEVDEKTFIASVATDTKSSFEAEQPGEFQYFIMNFYQH